MKHIDFTITPPIKSLLIHGLNNIGKTHILGSVLAYEKGNGRCVYLGMEGEPYTTLMASNLEGVELIEISSIDEVPPLLKEIGLVYTIALDSVQRLAELAAIKITGGVRAIGEKEDHGKEWNKLKFEVFKVLELCKHYSDLFVAVSPSNIGEERVTGVIRIGPDIPGIKTLLGRFNFAGYLEALPVNPTVTKRVLSFHTRVDVATRQNGKKAFTKPLEVVSGLECWKPIKTALENSLAGI